MKTKIHSIRLLALTGAAALTIALCPSLHAAAFQNGSFEINGGNGSGTVTGWTLASTTGAGAGGSLLVTTTEGATDGAYAVAFDANQLPTGTETFSQTFTTLALQTYRVTLDFGALSTPAGQTFLSRLQVEARDGVSISSGTELITPASGVLTGTTGGSLNQNTNVIQMSDSTGANATNGAAPNVEFSTVTFTFTAQSANTTLVFTDLSTGGADAQDAILDNVRIATVVPEPSTWAAVLAGAGLLGLTVRRRRARLG